MALPLGVGEAGPDDKAMEPGVEAFRVAQPGQVAPGGHERILERVFCPLHIAEDLLGEREEAVAADPDQVGVRLPVTVPRCLDTIAIHQVRP